MYVCGQEKELNRIQVGKAGMVAFLSHWNCPIAAFHPKLLLALAMLGWAFGELWPKKETCMFTIESSFNGQWLPTQ